MKNLKTKSAVVFVFVFLYHLIFCGKRHLTREKLSIDRSLYTRRRTFKTLEEKKTLFELFRAFLSSGCRLTFRWVVLVKHPCIPIYFRITNTADLSLSTLQIEVKNG